MKRCVQLKPYLLLSAALSLGSVQSVFAEPQTVPEDRLDPGYESETPVIPPSDTSNLERAAADVAPSTAPSATIQGIQFVGAEVPAIVAASTEPFLGRPADTATLKELAAAMTSAYKKSNVVLFTLAIPAQDLSDGVVDILIAEGYVRDVITAAEGKRIDERRLRGYLKPVIGERPASRKNYERGMTLARREEGFKVTPRLSTLKDEPGAVALVLNVEEKENGFAFGYDSRESRLVDAGRISASGFAYSTLRRGDALRGRLTLTPDGTQSRSASVQYATPIGEDGLKFAAAGAYQETRPSSVPIEGNANFLTASLSYPVLLNFNQEVSLNAAIDRTESTNTALGSVLANENISAARLGARASWVSAKRSSTLGLTLAQGLDLGDANTTVAGGDTGFTKVKATASIVQKMGDDLFLRLKASGQWSDDILPANERLMIGGIEYGRGFDNGLVSFDKGYALSFEPAWRPLDEGSFAKSEVYLFADYADGSIVVSNLGAQTFDLSSAGIGTRISYKDYATLGLEWAEPLSRPVPGLDNNGIFTVTWALRYRPD
ncbi:hypothetical protein K1X12_16345 [Hyphomonas sp. WL0036]|uniref:ShlB/FhaC/HecB family hemolysin secretion/activation protein n=1 Tax=Hyphomonas sediminis TaxID=2866160 RepID=UPI001C811F3D|nr:ShlB/FhaC/HecB family hemolysin secretion/activation protein [Hyphomonas sediminis]MBY9068473.1 hypothetical protein [Hyphomonas sediminis]